MEKSNPEQKKRKPDYLPQSEKEWLETGKFHVETVAIEGNQIKCALVKGLEGKPLVTMVGGIPRDPERREKLPLINKLYGHLALRMLDENESSLLYNQPATGGSTGEWTKETLQSRTKVLAGITEHFHRNTNSFSLSLVGTSAGAYMAVNALEQLEKNEIRVSKIALLSPAAYPQEAENVPYGEAFSNIVRNSWDVTESPIFSILERYIKSGGSVFISFFEADNPPIPTHIQEYFTLFAQRLSKEGGFIDINIIPGVAHNFRRIGVPEGLNAVDNDSIRKTTTLLVNFLK